MKVICNAIARCPNVTCEHGIPHEPFIINRTGVLCTTETTCETFRRLVKGVGNVGARCKCKEVEGEVNERPRQKRLREDLQAWQDHPMGTAMAIQRLALEVAELNEINDALVEAMPTIPHPGGKLISVIALYEDGSTQIIDGAVVRAAIAKARGEQ